MIRYLTLIICIFLLAGQACAEKLCAVVSPAEDNLCVVNTEAGSNWYLFTGCEDMQTITPPKIAGRITHLIASESGRYLVVGSQSAGKITVAVYTTDRLDYGEPPLLLRQLPAGVAIDSLSWEEETLLFDLQDATGSDIPRYRYLPGSDLLQQSP